MAVVWGPICLIVTPAIPVRDNQAVDVEMAEAPKARIAVKITVVVLVRDRCYGTQAIENPLVRERREREEDDDAVLQYRVA